MKKVLLILIFMMSLVCSFATLDEAIDDVLTLGGTYWDGDTKVFMAKPYFEGVYLYEENAYAFLAHASLFFMAVQEEWAELDNSSNASYIKSIEAVAAPWSNDYQLYIVSIPMYEICNQFGDSYDMTQDELTDAITSYVRNHADHTIDD